MKYKGYFGRVEYDSDSRMLHGEVAGLRDVITFQADSVARLEKAFRNSVDDYLAFCRDRGEKPEKPYSGHFVVRTTSDLHRLLSAFAKSSGKSLNAVVVDSLRAAIAPAVRPTKRKRAKST